ncbi:MAG: glycolate oxidase iron-sulfur subunit [Acidithiobacillales bacterium SG8_45]|jgi:glycolate oxidase iron-sulfur subunit|nr:MAG: glycolate oxidase iron-sulfur subunit [Acidithiobacillales bacterium SG8_45]
MQTNISKQYIDTAEGQEADRILRACVHCGFCTATCPTYQLLGDELDSPRGRIYLIKQMLEGNVVTRKTQLHLDRCLTCRACETTCPSGVEYGRLVDIGRELSESQLRRPHISRLIRYALRNIVPYPARFAALARLGQIFRPVMPAALRSKVPSLPEAGHWPTGSHARRMLVLQGCAQSVATPQTNSATARILDRLGIELIAADKAGCCGAVSHHLSAVDEGRDFVRRNIDAWWPHVEQGAEAIVVTASGCGTMVKDYGHLLRDDPAYAEKAETVSRLAQDISEVLREEDLSKLKVRASQVKVAFHSPCTLQHGQQLAGVVESILTGLGFTLTDVTDPHLCCGSAGTYSVLQPALSQQLLSNKLDALQKPGPDVIATANIGCQMHMSTRANVPVRHWIEVVDQAID